MDLGLKDKVAVVTGGSRGIGRSIALGFAAEGCRVVVCARGAAALHTVADELRRAAAADVLTVAADVTQDDDVQRVIDQTIERFGAVHIAINNVGGRFGNGVAETSIDDWARTFDANLFSGLRLIRAVVPHMRGQGGGAIVNISSIWGKESGGSPTYNASKSAEISVTKAAARELAKDHIRVNSVAPGSIRFPGGSWDLRVKEQPAEMQKFVERELPYGRFGTPDEVANVVVFLASARASLVTGATVVVDGAQSRSNI